MPSTECSSGGWQLASEPKCLRLRDVAGVLFLPEPIPQEISQYLSLQDILSARQACRALCTSFSGCSVNLYILMPKPIGPTCDSCFRPNLQHRMPRLWTNTSRLVLDWRLWFTHEVDANSINQLFLTLLHLNRYLSSTRVRYHSLEFINFPTSEEQVKGLYHLRSSSVIHHIRLGLFQPTSLYQPYDVAVESAGGSLPPLPRGAPITHLSCKVNERPDGTLVLHADALATLPLQDLKLYIVTDLTAPRHHLYQDTEGRVPCDPSAYPPDLLALGALTTLTSLQLHAVATASITPPAQAAHGDNPTHYRVLRGVGGYFFAPNMHWLTCLTQLQHLSIDMFVPEIEDDDVRGGRSSGRFFTEMRSLRTLKLRVHPQTGLQALTDVLAKLTQLRELHLTLLDWGREQGIWLEHGAPFGYYYCNQMSFLASLSNLRSTDLTFEQCCFWGYIHPDLASLTTRLVHDRRWETLMHAIEIWNVLPASQVCSLILHDVALKDPDFVSIAKLTALTNLQLTGSVIDDPHPVELHNLRQLTNIHRLHALRIQLCSTRDCPSLTPVLKFNDATAQAYAACLTRLRSLQLELVLLDRDAHDAGLTCAGVAPLIARLTHLTQLRLNSLDTTHFLWRLRDSLPPLDPPGLLRLLETCLPPDTLTKARLTRPAFERDNLPDHYGHLLTHLVLDPKLASLVASMSACAACSHLLGLTAELALDSMYGLLQQLLVPLLPPANPPGGMLDDIDTYFKDGAGGRERQQRWDPWGEWAWVGPELECEHPGVAQLAEWAPGGDSGGLDLGGQPSSSAAQHGSMVALPSASAAQGSGSGHAIFSTSGAFTSARAAQASGSASVVFSGSTTATATATALPSGSAAQVGGSSSAGFSGSTTMPGGGAVHGGCSIAFASSSAAQHSSSAAYQPPPTPPFPAPWGTLPVTITAVPAPAPAANPHAPSPPLHTGPTQPCSLSYPAQLGPAPGRTTTPAASSPTDTTTTTPTAVPASDGMDRGSPSSDPSSPSPPSNMLSPPRTQKALALLAPPLPHTGPSMIPPPTMTDLMPPPLCLDPPAQPAPSHTSTGPSACTASVTPILQVVDNAAWATPRREARREMSRRDVDGEAPSREAEGEVSRGDVEEMTPGKESEGVMPGRDVKGEVPGRQEKQNSADQVPSPAGPLAGLSAACSTYHQPAAAATPKPATSAMAVEPIEPVVSSVPCPLLSPDLCPLSSPEAPNRHTPVAMSVVAPMPTATCQLPSPEAPNPHTPITPMQLAVALVPAVTCPLASTSPVTPAGPNSSTSTGTRLFSPHTNVACTPACPATTPSNDATPN